MSSISVVAYATILRLYFEEIKPSLVQNFALV